jgi:NitT/TauT family transport system substrate-binding protein
MRIRLKENFRAIFYAPYYAAQALGLYAREGVEVELISSSTPGDAVAGLLDGTIDLTWGGPMRVMRARDQDPTTSLVCFCESVSRDPFFLIGRGDRTVFRLTDLERLRFASVSEVPTPWMCLQHDLRRHGIDPNRLTRAPARSMAENLARLGAGELDVVQLFEPYAAMAIKQESGTILYAASERGPTVYTAFIASHSGIERNRSAFAAITRAIAHMQRWLAGHTADELADIVAPFFPDVVPGILTSALRRYQTAGVWADAVEMSREGFTRLGESLVSGGNISRPPVYEDCVDQSLSR